MTPWFMGSLLRSFLLHSLGVPGSASGCSHLIPRPEILSELIEKFKRPALAISEKVKSHPTLTAIYRNPISQVRKKTAC
jgi:hypothetical protein